MITQLSAQVKLKNVVAQFVWLLPLSLRGWRSQPKQSHTPYEIATHLSGARNDKKVKVLAMTKSVVLDESSNYKHMEGLMNQATTKMPKIEREIQIKQPPMVKEVK
jgi:hypothetical protein